MLPTRLADKSENSFRRSRRFGSNQVQLIFRFLSVPFADGRRHGTRREPHFHRRPSTQEATKKDVEEHFAQFDTATNVLIPLDWTELDGAGPNWTGLDWTGLD